MFNDLKGIFSLDPNFVLDLSYSREAQDSSLSLAAAKGSHRAGHSVQMYSPTESEYSDQPVINESTPSPSHSLDDFSISHLLTTESELALLWPLGTEMQQQAQAETVRCKVTESFAAVEPVPLAPEEACFLKMGNTRQDQYASSDKARYSASDKSKVSPARARYLASDKGKVSRARIMARYAASDKGKMARAKSRAKYAASDKGKATIAIRSARFEARRKALRQGFTEEVAKEKGESAADAKKGELSSAPACLSLSG